MAGIYFHIPFCKQACYYCDFHFSTQLGLKNNLVDALLAEISLQKDYLKGEVIETIYFGGGTPSLLSSKELSSLIDALHLHHSIIQNPEITLEANPDDLSREKLKEFSSIGINRLSIGIQSFDDGVLKMLNRAHSGKEAIQCIDDALATGIHNLSLDLIHSIPGQDDRMLKKNIDQVIAFSPAHISSYSLTIEEKTVFGKWKKAGKFSSMEEDASANQFELVMDTLLDNGYEHYEISNFAKPGFYSKHNTSYWQQKKYLGIGPSAHSYDQQSRQFNVANNSLYIKAIHEGKIPFEREILSAQDKINEYIFTTLRTHWGIDSDYLLNTFQFDIRQTQAFKDLLAQGLLANQYPMVTLTRKGKLLADQVASLLFV